MVVQIDAGGKAVLQRIISHADLRVTTFDEDFQWIQNVSKEGRSGFYQKVTLRRDWVSSIAHTLLRRWRVRYSKFSTPLPYYSLQ